MKKKTIIIIGIIVILIMGMGVSFAYWMMNVNQKDKNRITSECFKLTMEGTEGISLEKAYPITNEEGESLDPYTFTIENICETTAAYQVNLEQMETEKDISGKYIKVELDNKEPKNYDKYDETEITLKENGKEARKLTTGILRPSEKVSYSIKLWMDEKTPAISEVMNASFKSKVTVIASYLKKEEVPPEVAIQISRCSNNITAKIEATGNKIESYEYQIDEEEVVSKQESTHTFSDTARGTTHTIKVKVTDEYGNETTKEERIEIPNYPTLLGKQIGKDIKVVTEGEGLYEVTHCNETIENDELSEEAKEGFLLEEYRYAGSNPDNYITFNNETWRIIGLVNVLVPQDDGTEKVEQRVKIIKNESIGNLNWDLKEDLTYTNNWSESSLQKLLNNAYYNGQDTKYLNCQKNSEDYASCLESISMNLNFSETGIKENARNMIETVNWNIAIPPANANQGTPNSHVYSTPSFYQLERGTNTHEGYSHTWKGNIGLIYLSDYGYTTSGGSTNNRSSCLTNMLNDWHDRDLNLTDCYQNSWIYNPNDTDYATLVSNIASKTTVIRIINSSYDGMKGSIRIASVAFQLGVLPVLYLKDNITIEW